MAWKIVNLKIAMYFPGLEPVQMGLSVLTKLPRETEHLLLLLNGLEPSDVAESKIWFDSLPAFPSLKNVAVLRMGPEDCAHFWNICTVLSLLKCGVRL